MGFNFSNSILKDLNDRGFLYQFTDDKGLDDLFNSNKEIVFYVGFDPTAQSLHVGHLLWIKLVNKLQKAGLKPIVIIGGATSKIGDPTWKDKQRVMLDKNIIQNNTDSIMRKLSRLISFDDSKSSAKLLNNDEWLSKINYLEFLRDFGPMFSVNKMLAMDSVSLRLERKQHLSFLEFNYMLLQSYDFLHLFETHNCKLQIGGADQWSNMIFGVDLIRRKTGKQAFGMSMPLLTTSDGKKMGKTENGAIWLDENLTTPFNFWQYWRNVSDSDVSKLLKLFSDLDIDEIDSFVRSEKINEAKCILADSITKFVHPDTDLRSIKSTSIGLFGKTFIDVDSLEIFAIPLGTTIDSALVISKLAESKTAARNLINGKGVKIDGVVVEDYKTRLAQNSVLSVGKKKFAKVKII
ncbi:MAG: tyrosine--tRNA ligase [Holosporales bacterium]|jgi:tyrosyl-tRNA synthetase|nr:tyrosine--tRNA ligase [Holosporales bacterium]